MGDFHGLVHVGEHRDSDPIPNLREGSEPFFKSRSGRRFCRCPIGLLVGTFEYIYDVVTSGQLCNRLGNLETHRLGLNYTGAGDKEEVAARDSFGKIILHGSQYMWLLPEIQP